MGTKTMKKNRNSILRAVIVALSVAVQIGWILTWILWLNESAWVSLATSVLTVVVVVKLYSRHTNSAMKMPWILLIMALPIMGMCLYFLFELLGDPGVGKRLRQTRQMRKDHLAHWKDSVLDEIPEQEAGNSRYLQNSCGWPAYSGTEVTYYPEASDAFEAMKQALRQAEHFIFLEYFIVEDGSSFREIEEILVEKVKQGVQVRLLYDDVGSIGYVNLYFAKRLNDLGIRCYPFNPALPILNLFMNHRDHRKIAVIDGRIGFTGGYNLADEYFGRVEKFGKWKDTGLKLEGQAVRSLTAAFLEMWQVQSRKNEDWSPYLRSAHRMQTPGFVQPFADNPLGEERAAEDVYLNLINRASRTLYFMTPYLIITDELDRALGLAAKRGVDVRIVTPGIPDKKTVYAVTRSYYAGLARQGVRIFEYSPGFCHGKMCIADGVLATVGTSNLDYRSLYHHFENNVLLVGCPAVADIQSDFEEIFPRCREVTEGYAAGRGAMLRVWQCMLRLFAPLM